MIINGLRDVGDGRRTWTGVLASLARGQSVSKIGPLVREVTGLVIEQTGDVEDHEAVEGALAVRPTNLT